MANSTKGITGNNNTRDAILLTAFGTSVQEANSAYDNIEEEFRKAFPDTEIRWAYTSTFIRKKLRERGKTIDSPAEALARLGEDGFDHVYVQSLHIIPGSEYHDVLNVAERFNRMPEGLKKTTVIEPLLYSDDDMHAVSNTLIENIPQERKSNEAVVFMGHGSHHAANIYYPGMQYYLWNKDDNLLVGTVEGAPTFNDVLEKLKAKNIKKIWLSPFMAVAGDHAKNDMAGDGPESWKTLLEKEGFQVQPVLKGMAEYDNIVKIWIDHLKSHKN